MDAMVKLWAQTRELPQAKYMLDLLENEIIERTKGLAKAKLETEVGRMAALRSQGEIGGMQRALDILQQEIEKEQNDG